MMQEWTKPKINTLLTREDGPRHFYKYLDTQGFRRCLSGDHVLANSEFYLDARGYLSGYCKECNKTRSQSYYIEHIGRHKDVMRRSRIGAALGTYEALLSEFGARCMICGTTDPGGRGKDSGQFHLDHDDESGLTRGLLCSTCNPGIGMLKHDIRILRRAIEYLQYWQDQNQVPVVTKARPLTKI